MKTKIRILKWLMVLVLFLGSAGVWAQSDPNPLQTVCPGSEPYLVTPGNPANTFLWSISTGTSGVDWTISSPTASSTNVIWENLTAAPITYTLTFTEDNGTCQTIQSVDVTVRPRPVIPTVNLTQPTCAVSTGTITVTLPVPAAGITYTITGTSPVVGAVSNATGIFAGLAPGVYDVTTTNSVGCTSLATSATINIQPASPSTSAILHN